ncbi:MAG TPA: DUF4294 domain-containing protein [Saprospiraceae bacterium]|nr:DUF4294 domain-containing protein [Saprospiraceae bacterium]
MKNRFIFLFVISFFTVIHSSHAQSGDSVTWHALEMMVVNGDTIYFASQLDDVVVTSPRKFKDSQEYALYLRYKKYAAKVYPYAVEAVKLYRQMEEATEGKSKHKRKKYVRKTRKKYKPKYKAELKNLTRTQGMILTKMIEKALDMPMYEVIKKTRGSLSATFWNLSGKSYGYHLKQKYEVGQDPLLDIVLDDLEVKYEEH